MLIVLIFFGYLSVDLRFSVFSFAICPVLAFFMSSPVLVLHVGQSSLEWTAKLLDKWFVTANTSSYCFLRN